MAFQLTRRLFLGTVASAAASSVIVEATPADIAQFAKPGLPIAIAEPEPPPLPRENEGMNPGMFVYNYRGEILGVVESIRLAHMIGELARAELSLICQGRTEVQAVWSVGTSVASPRKR